MGKNKKQIIGYEPKTTQHRSRIATFSEIKKINKKNCISVGAKTYSVGRQLRFSSSSPCNVTGNVYKKKNEFM